MALDQRVKCEYFQEFNKNSIFWTVQIGPTMDSGSDRRCRKQIQFEMVLNLRIFGP